MDKPVLTCSILIATIFFFSMDCYAQADQKSDSAAVKKKRRLIGILMKSISHNGDAAAPVKTVNPFLKLKGKTIRSITIVPLGFDRNLHDTSYYRRNVPTRIANSLHKNSTSRLIRKNLFFREGDKILPLQIADNERFLREQEFLQDALIMIGNQPVKGDSVDLIIYAKDVFSIGGAANLSSMTKARLEIKEENLAGSGNRISGGMLFDKNRSPRIGYAAEYAARNIGGNFVNWATGVKSFNNEINSGRLTETRFYTQIEKPLVSRYTEWTGAMELSYNQTSNNYLFDSVDLYRSTYRYQYGRFDLWGGYNFGGKDRKDRDSEKRLRHFVGLRTFYTNFYSVPQIYKDSFDYKYADLNGALISYSLYKQNFYRTNFIYGFGRNEDVPEGVNATIIGGYTNKQGLRRSYFGLEFDGTHFTNRGYFTRYMFKSGGFLNGKRLEDVDLLAGIDHFTRLRVMNDLWRNRNFVSVYLSRQLKPKLNEPLFISSDYGLPYFKNGQLQADTRATFKIESVFFNLRKIVGFRVAPFIFSDVSFLKPLNTDFTKIKGYSAFGGGFRTRNENLIFGTIEVRAYLFPRPVPEMRNWKVELSTNLKFKYNSSFIKRPEFVIAN
jgi:hypothetical protein